jgi:hypothetical protein
MADYGGIFRQVRLGIMSFGDREVSMRSGRVGVSGAQGFYFPHAPSALVSCRCEGQCVVEAHRC